MNDNPLISIIIPCYNAAQSLQKCLDSVVTQDYANLEIILVDDGSTDRSERIYRQFQQKDDRIKVIRQDNAGVSRARNRGLKAATGEYLCFVDADDRVKKNYCSALYALIARERADIAIVEASYEDEEGNVVFEKPTSEESIIDGRRALALLLEDRVIQSHPWGKLYKAVLLQNISFPEDLKCFEDYSTLFKIFDKAVKVVKSNEKLYHYIQHPDSLSHNMSAETAYQFYLAIVRVFSFWETTTHAGNRKLIIRNVIRKLFMVLKRILRSTAVDEMTAEKENIRRTLRWFLSRPATEIGLEYYLYLRLYCYYPLIYTRLISRK